MRVFSAAEGAALAFAGGVDVTGGGSLLVSADCSIAGLAVVNSSFALDAASAAALGGTIRFENAAVALATGTTIVAGSSLAVSGRTALLLTNCTLDASVSGRLARCLVASPSVAAAFFPPPPAQPFLPQLALSADPGRDPTPSAQTPRRSRPSR